MSKCKPILDSKKITEIKVKSKQLDTLGKGQEKK